LGLFYIAIACAAKEFYFPSVKVFFYRFGKSKNIRKNIKVGQWALGRWKETFPK